MPPITDMRLLGRIALFFKILQLYDILDNIMRIRVILIFGMRLYV